MSATEREVRVVLGDLRPEDHRRLEELVCSLYVEDPSSEAMTPRKVADTVECFAQFPERGRIVAFYAGRHLVGYAILVFYWSNEYGGDLFFVDEIYVEQQWRNRGVATRFFNELFGGRFGKPKAVALEVTPRNSRALAYYQRLGFSQWANTHLVRRMAYSLAVQTRSLAALRPGQPAVMRRAHDTLPSPDAVRPSDSTLP